MPAIARRLPLADALSSISVVRRCRQVYDLLAEWQTIAKERASLARLDDRLLADIGLTREQRALECAKSLWSIAPTGDLYMIRNCIDPNQNW
jgi:uncharacterized protein YjiS (DUF1127 family)